MSDFPWGLIESQPTLVKGIGKEKKNQNFRLEEVGTKFDLQIFLKKNLEVTTSGSRKGFLKGFQN